MISIQRSTLWYFIILLFTITIILPKEVYGAPIPTSINTPSFLTNSDVENYASLAKFAADAYCTGLQVGSQFGQDGKILWKAGNGVESQMAFIAYSPTAGIVLSHEGTNQSSPDSIEYDLRIKKVAMHSSFAKIEAKSFNSINNATNLNSTGNPIQVAQGFQNAWLQTSNEIIKEINQTLQKYPNETITITGHSLGAAISLFGALAIRDNFPNVKIQTVLFGMPRVGNSEFANLVDLILPEQKHIINNRDPVPHLPFQNMGFRQASGEIWIDSNSSTTTNTQNIICQGQENPLCSDSIHLGNFVLDDHDGPYFGVQMECSVTS